MVKYCKNCGAQLNPGARYCSKCKEPVNKEQKVISEDKNNKKSGGSPDQVIPPKVIVKKKKPSVRMLVALFLGVLIIGVLVATKGGRSSSSASRGSAGQIVQVYAGYDYTLGLRRDGTIVYAGPKQYEAAYTSRRDIQEICCGILRKKDGSYVTAFGSTNLPSSKKLISLETTGAGNRAALMSDGTVLSTPEEDPGNYMRFGSGWGADMTSYNLIDMECNSESRYGLQRDGTVLGWPSVYRFPEIASWKNVVSLDMGESAGLAALTSDGKVLVAGSAEDPNVDTTSWSKITKIFSRGNMLIGLRSDGRVMVTAGDFGFYEFARQAATWTDIVDISCSESHIVGLKKDGTVEAIGDNSYGQCNVMGW